MAVNVTEGIKVGDAVVVTAKDLVVEQNGGYVNLKCTASTAAVSAKWYAASSAKPAKNASAPTTDNPWGG